ncbi:FecCD family ABC transporter permease [Corynebacterium belfantii]|uniref:FecCD family ABC transporter permease n=1 Tax=Corynebacterium belfantii TaxID=2014537 RepID=UPI000DFBFDCC|nr:iron chelate uptake ABC transporter family permease subunit [Corynebacterium belfantii]MBG9288001.1 iron chelate uptake ABC transporter family permease subunit [Corynebacterium belfantii]STC66549.1 iron-siderophore uptake system transmembrane component [Corynebacterium diphtheriae]
MRVLVILSSLLLVTAAYSLVIPGAGLSTWQLLTSETPLAHTVVMQWRLPRVVTGILVGAALAIAGSLFQSLTRNPLGSPDIIGFSTGAYTGVIAAFLLGGSGFAATVTGALIGGLAVSIVVIALSVRTRIDGLRIILVGLGISAMLSALNRWLITRGELDTALSAASWGAGSLNGLRWTIAIPACCVLAILITTTIPLRRFIDVLSLGDDLAVGLGLRLQLTKLLLLVGGVSLVAATTAVAGPIAFVALASPHIARALTSSARTPLVETSVIGALLIIVADLIGQRLFYPTQLPVGLVTVTIGGMYLLWLIARGSKENS